MAGGIGAILDRLNAEVLNTGDVDLIDELVSPDFIEHDPPPGMGSDRAGFKQMVRDIHRAFSDFSTTVEDQIVAGDKVVERWWAEGIHTGEWLGIPASGNRVRITGIDISRIEGGQVVEHWTQIDVLGMMQQMGALPEG